MHHVYILLCLKDPTKHYIGLTTDLKERIDDHNRGDSRYTKTFLPWELETFISFKNKKLAASFEKYLKVGSGHALLKKRFLPK